MIDLEKLEADVRRWASVCRDCVIYAGGFASALLLTWLL